MNALCTNSNLATSVDLPSQCVLRSVRISPNVEVQKKARSRLVNFISAGKDYLQRKYNQRIDRQAFNYLLTLDDALLKDIGVTKADVIYASNQPLSTDASTIIEEIARRR